MYRLQILIYSSGVVEYTLDIIWYYKTPYNRKPTAQSNFTTIVTVSFFMHLHAEIDNSSRFFRVLLSVNI